jgi:murein DD-endopeptidase MepM/ murein hydrolase activator NlpD
MQYQLAQVRERLGEGVVRVTPADFAEIRSLSVDEIGDYITLTDEAIQSMQEWEGEADALAAQSAQIKAAATSGAPPAGNSSGLIWPVSGPVVSPFGIRWGRLHAGIDIAAPTGAPVVASASGRVTYAGWMDGYGFIVVIQHAGSLATAYAHNTSLAVSTGQTVSQGQQISAVGCTGHCYGPHMHFEVRVNGTPVDDPMGYL